MSDPLTCITCRNQCFYIVYLRYTRSRVMECLAIWNRWQLNNYMLLTVTFQHYIKDILPLEIYQRHLYSQSHLAFEPNAPRVPNAEFLKISATVTTKFLIIKAFMQYFTLKSQIIRFILFLPMYYDITRVLWKCKHILCY